MIRTLVVVGLMIASSGCTERLSSLANKVRPRFAGVRATIETATQKLPPSPIVELSGPALSPAATIVDGKTGNVQVVPIDPHASGTESLTSMMPNTLWGWLVTTDPHHAPLPAEANLEVTDDMRASVDQALAARYVLLVRSVDVREPSETTAGSMTIEAFLIELPSGALKRSVRSHVEVPAQSYSTMHLAGFDAVIGALMARAGVTAHIASAVDASRQVEPRVSEPDALPEGRCTVDTDVGEVSDVAGGLPCSEAEALAVKLRGGGIQARVVPVAR